MGAGRRLLLGGVLLAMSAVWGCSLMPCGPKGPFDLGKEAAAGQELQCPQARKTPVVDGVVAEWEAHPAPIQVTPKDVAYGPESVSGDEDLSGTIWVAWDTDNLYVAARVVDDTLAGTDKEPRWWLGDHLEVFLDTQYAPGVSGEFGEGQFQFGLLPSPPYAEPAEAAAAIPKGLDVSSVKVASATTDDGYTCEAAIPWDLLGVEPAPGLLLGADVCMSDTDMYGSQDSITSLVPGPWACARREHLVPLRLAGGR